MIQKLLTKLVGTKQERELKRLQPRVQAINALEPELQKLSDAELAAKTAEFRQELENRLRDVDEAEDIRRRAEAEALEALLVPAFAVVREAARRTVGMRPFDVQLIGGMVLHEGKIAEMKTGEGKTLVATLPAYLNALLGKGVHVVTVNDYLSRRDAVWMGQIYNTLGLSVGVLTHDTSYRYDPAHKELDEKRDEVASFHVVYEFLRPTTRREAYEADITYGTNNEFGFDYLRDNLEYEVKDLRQRPFHYAVVDEIDSILIDEARTPLIISSATSESEDLYKTFAGIVQDFEEDKDYEVDKKLRAITLTDAGIAKAEKRLGLENIYT